ncbi:FAD-binding oxidoreductase [Massilia sp. 9096]|uniref:FAD-dependent oxidoreductase n=1 Tax=Massilia sp. 9096 TaxID=1500894 RepID=UPI00055B8EC5|nr:FAD-binding oxidoreductase [Massilia sp. 9096]
MKRRDLLKAVLPATLLAAGVPGLARAANPAANAGPLVRARVRPGAAGWPSAAEWDGLQRATGGRLMKLESPFAGCGAPDSAACRALLRNIDNPYFIGDTPALTQSSGWQDAWVSRPSAYAVAAHSASDVAAAVNFARLHKLRLVVKGGGHSYKGGSNAPDSLLVWTRAMNRVEMIEAFVAQGGAASEAQPAVSIGAGAMWSDAYAEVTTRGGRYVQGGGCTTVGVPGLVQGGGFSNFSKRYGTAAASLIEAEVVTADGQVRIANRHVNPDLFWALKGGGGGTFGVVTRVTLRTHALPEFFGAAFGEITAHSNEALRTLIDRFLAFYLDHLFNPHWGEQVSLRDGKRLRISMVFQGLDGAQARAVWAPFLDWVRADPNYTLKEPNFVAVPARQFWNADFYAKHAPGWMVRDDRPGTSNDHAVWAGDREQAGIYWHGYQSTWLPASLLTDAGRARLTERLFDACQQWDVELHFNKGLAGAPDAALAAARETATHPGVIDAFCLAIIAGGGKAAYPGMPGRDVDEEEARARGKAIRGAMDSLRQAAPGAGAYVSESDYFEANWQQTYWGSNYPRLLGIKRRYDPDGLFTVRHGVGSEDWSEDGFTRKA